MTHISHDQKNGFRNNTKIDFDQNLETRVVSALSTFDLDVALEQHTTYSWVAIAYALYIQ